MLYKRTQARKKYPTNCALMKSPRMVTKRLQAHCQVWRTDQQPPDQQPIHGQRGLHIITGEHRRRMNNRRKYTKRLSRTSNALDKGHRMDLENGEVTRR
ncbi:hypothetical protein T265_04093 [Opisthorchis viverrini]|uniref:Uncharacterized protein n=1 Tax=Opisthorchis viverrini TaxID=6198 RepID=A0A074ZTW3_OPIVI|nr:hypothetical protein T265_04093 [Opisthorchis viverrini]KER29247.1 hypothetical protein T265_04093 [Opisthorchis viverrini]